VPDDLPVLACGMVGSTSGWREVPYVSCPADPAALARALVHASGTGLPIVPGVRMGGPLPDVMRGEETQIIGACARDPALAEGAVMILPGTHAKWVRVTHGRIEHFRTFMTGEVFALLMKHSILGRPFRDALDPAALGADEDAFALGVLRGAEARDGIAPLLFSTRSLFLAGEIAACATRDYLSGLLVGDEIRAGLAFTQDEGDVPVALVGEAELSRRYATAFSILGLPEPRMIGNTAAEGLCRLARAAGLIAPEHTTEVAP
jgi:2-dehydro-3-deoxygalactonokinase